MRRGKVDILADVTTETAKAKLDKVKQGILYSGLLQ